MRHTGRTAVLTADSCHRLGLRLGAMVFSNPAQNLDLSNIPSADQVQTPSCLPLADNTWSLELVLTTIRTIRRRMDYDVYYRSVWMQTDSEQFPHDGLQVAKLTLSSTEDYGLAVDNSDAGIVSFLDDRRNQNNLQVTGMKITVPAAIFGDRTASRSPTIPARTTIRRSR